MKNKVKFILIISLVLIIISTCIYVMYYFNIIPHRKYDNSYFNIEKYISNIDKDNDGIDDQSDILKSAREYVGTKPKYKSKYYKTGYPNDEYGVCTDVVAFAMLNSGYDLMNLVNNDIINNRTRYNLSNVDKSIDFRRVKNLKIYFENNAISLTTDINDIGKWQGGDIVIFENHIGIVSDKRNRKGIPFVIHNANPFQTSYEEDILDTHGSAYRKIVGHYRIS